MSNHYLQCHLGSRVFTVGEVGNTKMEWEKMRNTGGLPWWSSGYDSVLPMQGGRPGIDPWSGNKILHATTKTQHSQINK